MNRIKSTLRIICFLGCQVLLGQEPGDNYKDAIIPPSPTASGLGKYGEIPISHFTGTANISIPLYELETRGMSIPLSLSYHSSGVRVEENSSWVGTGWSLNAGGVITRSVKGLPDEDSYGLMSVNEYHGGLPMLTGNDVTIDSNDPDYSKINDMLNGTMDTEPDIFYYNFLGSSGKLFFDDNGDFHTIPYQNMKFIKTISTTNNGEWIISDGNGDTYYFGSSDGSENGIEYSRSNANPNLETTDIVTAWYLTKIVTHQNEEIIFTYGNKSIVSERENSQSYTWYQPNVNTASAVEALTNEWSAYQLIGTSFSGKSILETISSDFGEIYILTTNDRDDLPGGVLVSQILAYDAYGNRIKNWAFNYDYEESHHERIYLKSVQQILNLNITSEIPAYQFEYYSTVSNKLPERFSKNQDYWGYFNGANNSHLLGASYNYDFVSGNIFFPPGFQFADRDANSGFANIGSLKRITYPTGGYTEIEYEVNRATTPENFMSNPVEVGINASRGEYNELFFDIDIDQTASIQIFFDSYRDVDNFRRPVVRLEKFNGTDWDELRVWRPANPSLEDETLYENILLSIGNYKLITDSEDCLGPDPCNTPAGLPDDYFAANADLQYFDYDIQSTVIDVGGIRVSKIFSYDGISTTRIKKYTYEPGILVSTPEYVYEYEKEFCVEEDPLFPGNCSFYSYTDMFKASSQSYAVLGTSNGSHVIYPEVHEYQGENGENGITSYKFRIDGVANGSMYKINPPFVPSSFEEYLNGQLISKIDRRADNQKIKEINNVYDDGGELVNYQFENGVKLLKNYYPSSYSMPTSISFYYDKYKVQSKWVYMKSTSTKTFDPSDESKYVETVTQYEYDPVHTNPSRIINIENNGKATVTENYYSPDYQGLLSGTIYDMSNSYNIHNSVIESVSKEGTATFNATTSEFDIEDLSVLGGRYVKYDVTGNGIVYPKEITNIETDSPIDDNGAVPLTLSIDDANGHFDITYYATEPSRTNSYDDFGNLMESTDRSGITTSFIWGYNDLYPVAQLEGLSYSEIEGVLGQGFTLMAGDYLSQNQIDDLKTQYPGIQITTYTYKPGVGLSSITDPNGFTIYYIYDGFSRLQMIKDHDGRVLRQYEYNYATQTGN